MAFSCWAADDPLIAVFGSSLPSSTKRKNVARVEPHLAKFSWSAHAMPSYTSKLALPYCREAFILLKTHSLRKLNWFLYYELLLMKCAYIQFHNTYPMNQYFMLLGGKTAFHCFSLFLFNILLPLYSELLAQEKSLGNGKWLNLLFGHKRPIKSAQFQCISPIVTSGDACSVAQTRCLLLMTLVVFINSLCKQFGPRSGPTVGPDLGPNCFRLKGHSGTILY